ncbi:MAG: hypothetical protein ABJC13_23055 [Acidobacteriota bacterium]
MGLKEVLSRMKLVELPNAGPAAPSPGAGASPKLTGGAVVPDLDQLLASIPASGLDDRKLESLAAKAPKHAAAPSAGEEREPATAAASEIPDFAAVYRAAGIEVPAHGYSAFKILEILESPDLAPLDGKAKAAALGGFLKMNPGGPVPLSDVIQDAVRRDQALDRFEEFLRGKLTTREAEAERQNAALQAEIDELSRKNRETMETNRRALEAERANLESWRVQKQAEEQRLFEAVAPFVDQNPITTGPAKGPS